MSLGSFTDHNILKVLPCYCMYRFFILFNCGMMYHPMCHILFINPAVEEDLGGFYLATVSSSLVGERNRVSEKAVHACYSYIISGVRLDLGWWLLVHSLS